MLPGSEWTHYKGHAGFLGVAQPYKGSFVSNSLAETQARLKEAQSLGAMVVLNHPFCPQCPWLWGFEAVAHDAVEVWNGVMSERNLRRCTGGTSNFWQGVACLPWAAVTGTGPDCWAASACHACASMPGRGSRRI